MALIDLINELTSATSPDRQLDVAIAIEMGYRKKEPELVEAPDGRVVKRHLWLVPSGKDVDRIPKYTESIHHALLLSKQMVASGGVSWEDKVASAKVGGGPYCQAASPAIALCIAALSYKLLRETNKQK